MIGSLSPLSPHMTLASGVLLVLAAGMLGDIRGTAVRIMAAVTLLMALLGLGSLVPGAFGPLIRLDGVGLAWQFLFLAGALPVILLLDFEDEVPAALVLGSVLGMALLAVSDNLLLSFVGFELMSLPAYILVARGGRKSGIEAALKYFFSGGTASALFLMGIALHYGASGDLSLSPASGPLGQWGQALLGAAALFKIGSFPLHFWLPDVYEAADPEVAGFFSTAMKSAGFLLLMRVTALSPDSAFAASLPAWGVLTMLAGALSALRQKSLSRLFAYSSLSHAGFLLLGVGAWAAQGAPSEEAAPLFFYLAATLFISNGAFVFLKVSGLESRSQLAGYGKSRPVLAALFAAILFSLAGIPPTGGFVAKLLIFWEAVKCGLFLPVALAGLGALIALAYALALIELMYFEEPAGPAPEPRAGDALLWVCAAGSVLLGLAPWFVGRFSGLPFLSP